MLVLGPEPYLAGGLRAHGLGPAARVRQEAVEAHSVVEERAELVADGLKVGRGEPASARLLEGHQLVLPPHDVDRGNLVRAVLAQVGRMRFVMMDSLVFQVFRRRRGLMSFL